jgi:protoporphyrinogen IX oxidase
MLWVKAFHILLVMSWMAGLFYLPRILVNLAMVPAESTAERARLLLMGYKLVRFSTILAIPAIVLGLWLWLGFGITGAWMHAKLAAVVAIVGYHHACGRLLKRFAAGTNRRSHRWFRVFNEAVVLLVLAVVVLVVVKPF